MNKNQQNTHGVPTKQWTDFGPLGQQFYNDLYKKSESEQKQLISSLNIPSGDKTKYEQKIGSTIDHIVLESTQLFVQSQLQEHD